LWPAKIAHTPSLQVATKERNSIDSVPGVPTFSATEIGFISTLAILAAKPKNARCRQNQRIQALPHFYAVAQKTPESTDFDAIAPSPQNDRKLYRLDCASLESDVALYLRYPSTCYSGASVLRPHCVAGSRALGYNGEQACAKPQQSLKSSITATLLHDTSSIHPPTPVVFGQTRSLVISQRVASAISSIRERFQMMVEISTCASCDSHRCDQNHRKPQFTAIDERARSGYQRRDYRHVIYRNRPDFEACARSRGSLHMIPRSKVNDESRSTSEHSVPLGHDDLNSMHQQTNPARCR